MPTSKSGHAFSYRAGGTHGKQSVTFRAEKTRAGPTGGAQDSGDLERSHFVAGDCAHHCCRDAGCGNRVAAAYAESAARSNCRADSGTTQARSDTAIAFQKQRQSATRATWVPCCSTTATLNSPVHRYRVVFREPTAQPSRCRAGAGARQLAAMMQIRIGAAADQASPVAADSNLLRPDSCPLAQANAGNHSY